MPELPFKYLNIWTFGRLCPPIPHTQPYFQGLTCASFKKSNAVLILWQGLLVQYASLASRTCGQINMLLLWRSSFDVTMKITLSSRLAFVRLVVILVQAGLAVKASAQDASSSEVGYDQPASIVQDSPGPRKSPALEKGMSTEKAEG